MDGEMDHRYVIFLKTLHNRQSEAILRKQEAELVENLHDEKKQKRNQYLKQPIVQLIMQPAHLFRQYRSYRFAQRRNGKFAVSVAGHAS